MADAFSAGRCKLLRAGRSASLTRSFPACKLGLSRLRLLALCRSDSRRRFVSHRSNRQNTFCRNRWNDPATQAPPSRARIAGPSGTYPLPRERMIPLPSTLPLQTRGLTGAYCKRFMLWQAIRRFQSLGALCQAACHASNSVQWTCASASAGDPAARSASDPLSPAFRRAP